MTLWDLLDKHPDFGVGVAIVSIVFAVCATIVLVNFAGALAVRGRK